MPFAACGYLLNALGRPSNYNRFTMRFTNRKTIRKVGDSLAVLLPQNLLQVVKLKRGDQVVVSVEGQNALLLTKVPTEFKERMIRA